MQYVSTRGEAPVLDFAEVVLAGLARDGGLYVPQTWPQIDASEYGRLSALSYADLAVEIMTPFVGGAIPREDFAEIVRAAYAHPDIFDHCAITPLRQLDTNDWMLDLFHGPTLAFKDIALQLLGRLFEYILGKAGHNQKLTIVGATSGDTGSAAIDACRDRDGIQVFMLHPAGRVSDVQRRQMTTVQSDNVFNIAVEGTFDDCQALLKEMFNDHEFRDRHHLGAVNSINWARVMAQIVYYFYAAFSLGVTPERKIDFSVPTGNFGDVFAGYAASRMGLPVGRLIVATNLNDILYRAFTSGDYSQGDVTPTISPAMDIQVSSNFERLLFELFERDGAKLAGVMDEFSRSGRLTLSAEEQARLGALFSTVRVDEEGTLAAIRETYEKTGVLVDPHTAVGLQARTSARSGPDTPVVTLSTAHPAKFPEAVEKMTAQKPGLPERLADLQSLEERFDTLPNDIDAIKDFVRTNI